MQMLLKGRNNGYVVTEKGVQEMNFYTSTTDNKRKQIKYAKGLFAIDKRTMKELQDKMNLFLEETATRKSLLLTLITINGLKQNEYSTFPQCTVELEQLFQP